MDAPHIRRLGLVDYQATWHAMRTFTEQRTPETPDEIWLLEHPAVYTVGIQAKPEHFPNYTNIPLVHTDRGGQITYHGPGQAILYTLLDLRRYREASPGAATLPDRKNHPWGVKTFIHLLEESVIQLLQSYGITGSRRDGAPGVYVAGTKIAALGLRIKNGCCYHGIALNVAMDLSPFLDINPCGYQGLRVTQLHDLGIILSTTEASEILAKRLLTLLKTEAS